MIMPGYGDGRVASSATMAGISADHICDVAGRPQR